MHKLSIPITLFIYALLGSPVLGGSSTLWMPHPRPDTCIHENTQTFVIDTSGSMQKGERFRLLKRQISDYLRSLPLESNKCQRIILIRFDTTADVLADGYLDNQTSRDRLIATLTRLRANGKQTNFDEAAKLIRLVWLQLSQNASADIPSTFTVRVLTDGKPDPSQGKPIFNLVQFLEKEFGKKTAFSWGTIVIPPPGTNASLPTPNSLGKVYNVTIPVETLPKFLEQTAPKFEPLPDSASGFIERSHSPNFTHLILILIAGSMTLLGFILFLNSRSEQKNSHFSESQLAWDTAVETVKSLSVTEKPLSKTNNIYAMSRPVEKVLLGLGVPATFGTKADCHYVIRELPSSESSEIIFSITATVDGKLLLRSHTQQPVSCDGTVVSPQGIELEGYKSFTVTYEERQWLIQPSFEYPQSQSMPVY